MPSTSRGGGVFTSELFHRGTTEDLRAKAENGDQQVERVLMAAMEFLESLERRPRNMKQPGCILCNAPLGLERVPIIFAFVHVRTDDEHRGLASAVCLQCTTELGHDYDRV
jgi:hypothetical protein